MMQIEEKPPGSPPFENPYEWIGGEERVKSLVERFYDAAEVTRGRPTRMSELIDAYMRLEQGDGEGVQ